MEGPMVDLTEILKTLLPFGISSVVLAAFVLVYRVLGMLLAVRYGYRFSHGKMIFEPVAMVQPLEPPKVVTPMLKGPKKGS